MGLFSNKKVISVDKREVIIIDKSDEKALAVVTERAIETFAHHDNMATFFPTLTFIFIKKYKLKALTGKGDFVRPKEVEAGKRIIYLPLKILKGICDKNNRDFEEYMVDTCRHESAHLYHFMVNDTLVKRKKVSHQISKKFDKMIGKVDSASKHEKRIISDSRLIRRMLMVILYSIHTEGIASYVEHAAKLPFNHETFRDSYRSGKQAVNNIVEQFEDIARSSDDPATGLKKVIVILEKMSSAEKMKTESYVVGEHMVYAIMYINKLSLEEIFHLKHFEFIKKYVSASKKINYPPLISLNTGDGILDYNDAIKKVIERVS